MPMTPEMDPLLLQANSGIIGTRLRAIRAAEKRLDDEVSVAGSTFGRSLDHESLWDAVTAILDHAAALSRMFWQPRVHKDTAAKRAAKDRIAEQLRRWLDVPDDSLLNAPGRGPRNTFEHWGENCADWYHQMAGRRVLDSVVTAEPWPEGDFYLRSYNYLTETATYGDATVELRPLLHEISDLYDRFGPALAYATTYPYAPGADGDVT